MRSREYYGRVYWDQLRSSSLTPGDGEIAEGLAESLVRYLRPGAAVLDVGCGAGCDYGSEFRRRSRLHVGIDLSCSALREAHRSVGLCGTVGDLEHPLPFSSGAFDGVICKEVLEHLFDPHHLLLEIHRVMRAEGILVASTPNIAHFSHRLRLLGGKFVAGGHPDTADAPWRDPHLRFFTRRSLCDLLTESGFRPLLVTGVGTALLTSMPVLSVLLARALGQRRVKQLSTLFNPVGRWWPSLFAGHLVAVARRDAP